ncbi:Adaptor protein complex AP-2 alpha subunit [Jaminaea rosea]|uniref:AP-2 complex subunit alpha n=1 Tax=Jaminaea rosea TaxID=1569628 RepID=A0A316UGP7_9BASI|nr:Adaptor protein complex AP-2 alpha subunit [Jaminaea rosea]PWN24370.1 Adaptor protein complex AP-2 alpha subunit [Jaminaea rosea]
MASFATMASGSGSSNSTNMKGLVSYIAALRQARHREAEEKVVRQEMAHIRQQFRQQLNGYQKKKYLSKVCFTYILGYEVDVGHMEAVNLIASSKYSEKQIGYLALTLLMHENSDLIRLVVNSIRKDLDDLNEVHNCLALHAIANIGGSEMAETLAPDVHRLLISPTSRSFVKKKAALTLLRLYRKSPEALSDVPDWAARIVAIMDDDDLGVATAVASLVMTMAQDHPDAFANAYPKAVDRLAKIIVEEDYSEDYLYYKVPAPWLQVKLLRLLQYWPASDDETIKATIHNVLDHIVQNSQNTPKNVQRNNAQNAILFEAINLAIHLDTESAVVAKASVLLGKFILSRETNVRYLGLDTMAHLAACVESLEPIKMHQKTIMHSLRDRDISVRRRGLDLLYSMCDVDNARSIVGEMLRYLQVADYALREELVLKIAILTEKFATEYAWYVDTILQLISSAGDHVGEEVWFRVVQIVTNNEDVQEYAATKAYEHLQSSSCHENLIKVGGYVLGEYGHLIANNPGASPIEQFHALHSRSHLCSQPTRALLLSTYVKWLNLFPEIREQLLYVLKRYTHVLDSELQQRACEYVALAERPDGSDELLQAVCDEMPPFPEKSSLLLGRLQKKHGDTNDKRTWIIGGKEVNRNRDEARLESLRRGPANGGAMPTTKAAGAAAPPSVIPAGGQQSNGAGIDDIMAGLEGLDMSVQPGGVGVTNGMGENGGEAGESSYTARAPLIDHGGDGEESADRTASSIKPTTTGVGVAAPSSSSAAPPLVFPPSITKSYLKTAFSNEGVLYEDGSLQIGLKTEFHGSRGRLALYLGNKISVGFTSLSLRVRPHPEEPDVANPAIKASMSKLPPSSLGAMTQIQQVVDVSCRGVATYPPLLHVEYLAGSLQSLVLPLPVPMSKFISPVPPGSLGGPAQFFERWKALEGEGRQAQRVFGGFKLSRETKSGVDEGRMRRVVEKGLRLGLLEGIDPKSENVVAAGLWYCDEATTEVGGGTTTSTASKVGILLRLEPNAAARQCRCTVRSTRGDVSAEVARLVVCALGGDAGLLLDLKGARAGVEGAQPAA